MSRTDHRRGARPRPLRAAFAGTRSAQGPGTSRLTPPGRDTPWPTRVPPNRGGTDGRRSWSDRDVRETKAVMKRHGRRRARQAGKANP